MERKRTTKKDLGDLGLGGMFRGLGGFLELLSEVAEKGGEWTRQGEIGGDEQEGGDEGKGPGPGKGMKAVYGFTVRVGGAGEAPKVEPFGNVKVREKGPVVDEVREPMTDLFDEADHVLVVAELPGVEAGDITFEVKDDVLHIDAARRDRKYHKEILLPAPVDGKAAAATYRNGVWEIKLPKGK